MKQVIVENPQDKSFREIVEDYTKYWYLFVLSAIVAILLAFIYLRYSTEIYKTVSSVIIKDQKSGGIPEELAGLSELGGFFGRLNSSKLENELVLFNSKRINAETVKALDLNVIYRVEGNIKDSELYGNNPITVKYLSFNDTIKNAFDRTNVPLLKVKIESETTYSIDGAMNGSVAAYAFGDNVSLPFGNITILPNNDYNNRLSNFIGKEISVKYYPIAIIASEFQKAIRVINSVANSNVVEISMESAVPDKAIDYINELVYQFNKDAINDRGQIALKTSNFIDDRLEIITRELDSVEGNKETFKSKNRLTDIAAEVQITLQNANEFEKRQFDVGTQLELSKDMINYIEDASNDDLLPSNIGLNSGNVSQSVTNYNQLVLERNRLLKNSTSKNPVIVNITNQIDQIRSNILSSLQNTRSSLQMTMKDLNFQESTLNSKIAKVPTNEKLFRGIERQQTIKEQLYLFLLQQREQASISLAVTAPKAKVVDTAYTLIIPVAPDKTMIYLGALLIGLMIPFVFIYVRNLLSLKIKSRADVERQLNGIPLIGEIPKIKRGDEELIQENDRSILAESFRILRTNLEYLFANMEFKNKSTKRIFVTSTVKGEGKTFVAFNLALTLATTGKKVVLVGADIRNPQLHRYLPQGTKSIKGVTEFIVDESLHVNDLKLTSAYNKNLDILLSGTIPPNPAELLMKARTNDIFTQLQEDYEYIIVDTAPSMLVTDTVLINKLADIMLYVIRANYTDKRLLEFTRDAIEEGRLSNISIVLNNVSMSNFGYGNKYGYTYNEEKESVWKKIFKR